MKEIDDIIKTIDESFGDKELEVGFVDDSLHKITDPENEDKSPKSISQIAYEQEYGLGIWKTSLHGRAYRLRKPPRPFMRKAELKNENKWVEEFEKNLSFESLGKMVSQDIKDSIKEITSPPLGYVALKKREQRGNFSDKPLIDTGEMIDSVTYKIS